MAKIVPLAFRVSRAPIIKGYARMRDVIGKGPRHGFVEFPDQIFGRLGAGGPHIVQTTCRQEHHGGCDDAFIEDADPALNEEYCDVMRVAVGFIASAGLDPRYMSMQLPEKCGQTGCLRKMRHPPLAETGNVDSAVPDR